MDWHKDPTYSRPGLRIEKVVLRRGAWSFLVQASVPGEEKTEVAAGSLGHQVTGSPNRVASFLP